jgi:GT2 family glycosyltransferase
MPRDTFEVIVVDNNDQPCPAACAQSQANNIRYIHHAGGGSYAARNRGVTLAIGEILVFTDSDCSPDDRWLEVLGAEHTSQKHGSVIAGEIRVTSESNWRNLHEDYDRIMHHRQATYVSQGFGATANLSMSRQLFAKVGPFDEVFMSGGDRDWCERAGRQGDTMHFCQEAVVLHPARRSWADLCIKNRRGAGGDATRLRKAGCSTIEILAYPVMQAWPRFGILWRSSRKRPPFRRMQLVGEFLLLQWIRVVETWKLFLGVEPERR